MSESTERDLLEGGALHVLYRPRVEEHDPESLADVQDLHLVLVPEHGSARQLTIGRKRLPDVEEHEANWGFVAGVADDVSGLADGLGRERYDTKTRGMRDQPGARVAASGRYAITRTGRDVRLSYVLDLPEEGAPQDALELERRAQYVLQVKNPQAGSPPRAGLPDEQQADYPGDLQERFDGRAWIGPDPTDLLDHEGTELLLIGARPDAEPGTEDVRRDDQILDELRRATDADPVAPLETGEWS